MLRAALNRKTNKGGHFLSRRDAVVLLICLSVLVSNIFYTGVTEEVTRTSNKKVVSWNGKNRRKFVSYTSSEWEQLWLDHVDEWQEKQQICQVLLNDQLDYVREFLTSMCTSRYLPPNENWCKIDDTLYPLWYDSASSPKELKLQFVKSPVPWRATIDGPARPVTPRPGEQHERVLSKFVFFDEVTGKEYTEYIEPLVSHLRFPLAKCVGTNKKQKVRIFTSISSILSFLTVEQSRDACWLVRLTSF
jgi:hypothetical protein